ncbi:MAG: hypothetical protein IH859_05320 [Chloroflexi bacterium]|nr:hypothetical protein [Chloroflexota bacterium]
MTLLSGYIHFRKSDGLNDQDKSYIRASEIFRLYKNCSLDAVTYTLELVNSSEQIIQRYDSVSQN